jgi:uncharacterized repeat protein (TIGR01451 family)
VAVLLAALLVLGASTFTGASWWPLATKNASAASTKITFCHATSSESNPYNLITADAGTVFGHWLVDNQKLVFAPGMKGGKGPGHVTWGDIIPEFTYLGKTYPALNMTAAGQHIWENKCAVPDSAQITVNKKLDGDPAAGWSFTATPPSKSSVNINKAGAGQAATTSTTASAGAKFTAKSLSNSGSSITVEEQQKANTEFVSASCSITRFWSADVDTVSGSNGSVSLMALKAGDRVTCTFYNSSVQKEPDPDPMSDTPEKPAFQAPDCDVKGSLEIPEVKGVDYYINGVVVDPGTQHVEPGTTVTVTAEAKEGFVLEGTYSWDFTFEEPNCQPAPGTATITVRKFLDYEEQSGWPIRVTSKTSGVTIEGQDTIEQPTGDHGVDFVLDGIDEQGADIHVVEALQGTRMASVECYLADSSVPEQAEGITDGLALHVNAGAHVYCSFRNETIYTFTTKATNTELGGTIHDVATLDGIPSGVEGRVHFALYGPFAGEGSCDGQPLDRWDVDVTGSGQWNSGNFTPKQVGKYYWKAEYWDFGERYYATHECGVADEISHVTPKTPTRGGRGSSSYGGLDLVKTGPGVASPGDAITYSFTATSTGNIDETNTVVTDVVPAGTTYIAGSAVCAGVGICTASYNPANRTVTWQIGTLAAGASRGVSFKVTVDTPASANGTTLENVGAVSSNVTPSVASNKVVTLVTAVLGGKVGQGEGGGKLPYTGAPVAAALTVSVALLSGGALFLLAGSSPSRRRG